MHLDELFHVNRADSQLPANDNIDNDGISADQYDNSRLQYDDDHNKYHHAGRVRGVYVLWPSARSWWRLCAH